MLTINVLIIVINNYYKGINYNNIIVMAILKLCLIINNNIDRYHLGAYNMLMGTIIYTLLLIIIICLYRLILYELTHQISNNLHNIIILDHYHLIIITHQQSLNKSHQSQQQITLL